MKKEKKWDNYYIKPSAEAKPQHDVDFYVDGKKVGSGSSFKSDIAVDSTKNNVWSVDTKTGAINQGDPSRIDHPIYDATMDAARYVANNLWDSNGTAIPAKATSEYTKKSTPKEDKFIVIDKETGFYYWSNTETDSFKSNAKTFDTVHEALRFADNIKNETIVDKL